jgi:hypothetical protein
MSEWKWFVVHKSDNDCWIVSEPFNNNGAAFNEAKRLAATFPGVDFFVTESTHIAVCNPVTFRSINK